MDREEYKQKLSNMKSQSAVVDESVVPVFQQAAAEVEPLLAEPRNDHASMNGVLYYNEENLEKLYGIENLSCGLDSHTILDGIYDLEHEVLDGLLDDVAIDDLHTTESFSSEDFLFDYEFANKVSALDFCPCEGSLLGNSSSESHSPGLSRSSISVEGVSESTKVPIAECECRNSSLDERVTCELHGAFRNISCQPSNGDCLYQDILNRQQMYELDDSCSLASTISSCEYEKVSFEACQPSALREKRFCRPTQRYIDEFSSLRSKEKVSTAVTKNKQLRVDSHNEIHHIKLGALRKIPVDKSICETSDAALPELQECQGHLKEEELESDEELFTSEAEHEYVRPKRSRENDRRKHQQMWTLSEVNKLIDGISEYGVGRWTDIKRLLFPFSSYRTPIDLRDKWRNLLRASCAQNYNKKKAEQKHNGLRPLPISVLHRVQELAKVHPYPRVRCSKKSSVGQVISSANSAQGKGTPASLSKRNVRRNKSM